MYANEIISLKVMDVSSGTTLGTVVGLLIDSEKRQVVALEVSGGMFIRTHYLPLASIKSIEHDVLMVASSEVLVVRGAYKTHGFIDHLSDRAVVTEDGKNLGTVHAYDVNTKNGDITCITVALDTDVLGGLWQTVGKRFDISRSHIGTLGDSVVVDSACAPS